MDIFESYLQKKAIFKHNQTSADGRFDEKRTLSYSEKSIERGF